MEHCTCCWAAERMRLSVWDIKGKNSVLWRDGWSGSPVLCVCVSNGIAEFSWTFLLSCFCEVKHVPLHLTLQDDNYGHRANDLSALGPPAGYQVHLLWTGWDGIHAVTEEPHLPFHTHPKSSIPIRALLQGGSSYVTMPRPRSHHGCSRTRP